MFIISVRYCDKSVYCLRNVTTFYVGTYQYSVFYHNLFMKLDIKMQTYFVGWSPKCID